MTPHLGDEDWRSVAERASKEMDPAKLTMLIAELCRALDGERKERVSLAPPPSTATGIRLCPGAIAGPTIVVEA
jgi:hypothetical protein